MANAMTIAAPKAVNVRFVIGTPLANSRLPQRPSCEGILIDKILSLLTREQDVLRSVLALDPLLTVSCLSRRWVAVVSVHVRVREVLSLEHKRRLENYSGGVRGTVVEIKLGRRLKSVVDVSMGVTDLLFCSKSPATCHRPVIESHKSAVAVQGL